MLYQNEIQIRNQHQKLSRTQYFLLVFNDFEFFRKTSLYSPSGYLQKNKIEENEFRQLTLLLFLLNFHATT
jgi:hypothetical protein